MTQICKHCKQPINTLSYLIDVRHQLGICKIGDEEE